MRTITHSPDGITTELIRALETVWQGIQTRHGDVPDVIITLGSGTLGVQAGQIRLGHFAAARWQHDDQRLPELFIAGEGLHQGSSGILGTMLHEATHGVAHTRGVQDTSRNGRYHNKRFKALGEELGLTLENHPQIGWSITIVPESTAQEYSPELATLDAALVLYRHREQQHRQKTAPKNSNFVPAVCGCFRRIRVAPRTLAQGPIMCGLCSTTFGAV